MTHCKPCKICPVKEICIQSVTEASCPIEDYDDSAKNVVNDKKENV